MEKEANISSKVNNSTKWAFMTEIMAKLVTPISNMILARILAPSVFGVLATVQMVLSFAEMLTDAGFQKYVIQHEYRDDEEKEQSFLVAIYTNVILGFFIWGLIILFKEELADLVGNHGLGNVFLYAGIDIPVVAFSSVQLAGLKRDFEFKSLMFFRLLVIVIPLLVTVPLALMGYEYWSLIIGFIFAHVVQGIAIFLKSGIHLRCYYSFYHLRNMFNFSLWTLLESVSIWLTGWIDTFIVTSFFSAYYLGIYKMSMASVQGLIGVVSGSIIPVLYSALSRLQFSNDMFNTFFFSVQRKAALLVIPFGCGIFLYRDLARKILFGSQWGDAELNIGLWSLTSCLMIIYGHFCSEVYRAKGSPRVSMLAQILHMFFLIPMIYYFSYDFVDFIWARNFARMQFIIVHFVMMMWLMKINPFTMVKNTWHYLLASVVMGLFGYYSRIAMNSAWYDWCSILLCVVVYFVVLCLWSQERDMLLNMWRTKKVF